MEFDWTTFALEIVNFLVLVWILKRFLYKPVTNAIAARKAAIEKTLAEARAVETAARSFKLQYENRMTDWESEKSKARAQLEKELEAERVRLRNSLQVSLAEERDRDRALEQRHAMEVRRELEEGAVVEGARFAARLLSRVACAELEERIRAMLIEELPRLKQSELQSLRMACQQTDARVTIASCYPLGEGERSALAQALDRLAARSVACEFAQDPELIAGLRISIGPWVLRCNLQDELKFFAEDRRAGH